VHAQYGNDTRAESSGCMILIRLQSWKQSQKLTVKLTKAAVGKKLGGCWTIVSNVTVTD
jgi:hypothetical protein